MSKKKNWGDRRKQKGISFGSEPVLSCHYIKIPSYFAAHSTTLLTEIQDNSSYIKHLNQRHSPSHPWQNEILSSHHDYLSAMHLLKAPEDLDVQKSVCLCLVNSVTPYTLRHLTSIASRQMRGPALKDCGHFTSSFYTPLILGCVRQRSRARTLGG